jgi:acyl-CoA dehydrogenase
MSASSGRGRGTAAAASTSASTSASRLSPALASEHEQLREQVRRFVDERVKPFADAWEAAGSVPREVLREMGALGMLGIRYPERFGGSGMDAIASTVLAEELGRSTYGGFAITVLVHTDMASPHLAHSGSPEQLERWLPGVIAGEAICAVAITEPDAGSDVAGMRTRARRERGPDGAGQWVLDGTKLYITNGVHADLVFVAARTDPQAKGSRGISMFAVERGTPGLSVGRVLDKHGWLSSDTAELVLDGVRVPESHLLGEENRGFYAVMRNFQNERLVLAAMAVGEAQAALALTLEYVATRRAFGAPLWSQPAIRQRLAMLSARIESARSFVYRVAWMESQGLDCVKEVSMLKVLCGELVNDTTYECLQFHGGYGYMRGTAIERMARDARIHPIGGGATEVMLEEIAKRLP